MPFLLPALAAAQATARKEPLGGEVKRLDFRVHLLTPAEVLARGVRDNLSTVYRNFEQV